MLNMPFVTSDAVDTIAALKKSFAFVTFNPDGIVMDANDLESDSKLILIWRAFELAA
jgi:hypothetical protein